jgi:hypothetical protein
LMDTPASVATSCSVTYRGSFGMESFTRLDIQWEEMQAGRRRFW